MNSSGSLIKDRVKIGRNSSFELLRILLILMILIEHGNLWFLVEKCNTESQRFAQCLIESICIGSVNAFVLISGWFGINSGLKKIGDLVFMVLFCTVPLLIVAILFHWMPGSDVFSINGIYQYVLGGNSYWFVVDYIAILIIAPILNKGILSIGKQAFAINLLIFYLIIFIYDFVFRSSILGSEGGYSVLWFAYIYVLARYMRLYGIPVFDRFCIPILLATILLQSILFYLSLIGLRYTNPLILIESICLIYIFKRFHFSSKIINFAATGALMAYLLHMQPLFMSSIMNFMTGEFVKYGYWIYMTEVVGLSILVFILSVFLNKIQAGLYNCIKSIFHKDAGHNSDPNI